MTSMRHIVSFSLYGDLPKYIVGALRNAEQVPKIYPGFKALFCVDRDAVPREAVTQLQNRGAMCVAASRKAVKNRRLWRYFAFDFPGTQIMLCRDADSRISERERAAVYEWLESDSGAHVMRDFPLHTAKIMGGTFGIKKKSFPALCMGELWRKYRETTPDWDTESDQVFLGRALWPVVAGDVLQHDEFNGWPGTRPFPKPFDPKEGFVGEIFLENGQGIPEHKALRGTAPFAPK